MMALRWRGWRSHANALGAAGQRLPIMVLGRFLEQAALGGATALLAWRLGPDRFAPVGALMVINSAAVTLSDYGIGLAVLRCASGELVSRRSLDLTRAANTVIATLGVLIGFSVGGDTGVLVGATGLIWAFSAEAFVRKAGAVNRGRGHDAARAEILGAALLAGVVLAFARGDAALVAVGAALIGKSITEVTLLPGSLCRFRRAGDAPTWRSLWGTQALAYAIANVDYVIVAALLGARWFSIYTLGFRVAVLMPSVVAYVATRASVTDLGAIPAGTAREQRYLAYVRVLFAVGIGGGIVAGVGAFALPVVLGASWAAVAPTIAILGIATPWRMVMGQAGALAIANEGARHLLRWEAVRFGVTVVVLGVAALVGYWFFVIVSSALTILGAMRLHRVAARHAGFGYGPALLRVRRDRGMDAATRTA
jgi:O-antigen/teichoic acid export membrane protein